MAELPNKLSALLRLAVQDAQKCEAMPEVYELDMNNWHSPAGSRCKVCMAGAVMAQTLGAKPDSMAAPHWFGGDLEERLEAVNAMRRGHFEGAKCYLSGRHVTTAEQARALEQAGDKVHAALTGFGGRGTRAPWPVYLEAADILEGVGL